MTSWSRNPRSVSLSAPAPGEDGTLWSPDELPPEAARSAGPGGDGGGTTDADRVALASEEGHARGYEAGFRAGQDAEAERLRTAVEALDEALRNVAEGEERWIANAEENVCALAVAVARQLIAREVATDQQVVVEMVREAVAEFPLKQSVTIRLNPSDLQAVGQASVSVTGTRDETRWIADPRIMPGGCLVAGRDRIIDGRVDVGLERIYNLLVHGSH